MIGREVRHNNGMETQMAKKHAEGPEVTARGERVLEKNGELEERVKEYDATALVGLKVKVYDAAIRRLSADGEETIEIPNLDQLIAAAVVARCLMDVKLRGSEIKAMRRIAKMTMAELTIARWESEVQPMGGYAEKILRLVFCAKLSEQAPGVEYADGKIAHLEVYDPWITNPGYEVEPIEFHLVKMKGEADKVWDAKLAA